jgi:hypothetical protein
VCLSLWCLWGPGFRLAPETDTRGHHWGDGRYHPIPGQTFSLLCSRSGNACSVSACYVQWCPIPWSQDGNDRWAPCDPLAGWLCACVSVSAGPPRSIRASCSSWGAPPGRDRWWTPVGKWCSLCVVRPQQHSKGPGQPPRGGTPRSIGTSQLNSEHHLIRTRGGSGGLRPSARATWGDTPLGSSEAGKASGPSEGTGWDRTT